MRGSVAPPTSSSSSRARVLGVPSSSTVMAAPVAQFDEDWEDFNEFKAADSHTSWTATPENSPQIQSFASLNETLSASFPYSNSACTNDSVRPVNESELLRDDE